MSTMTARQARDWPTAVAEVQRYVDSSAVPVAIESWQVVWGEETRPGRGHLLDALWLDGEYVAQIRMDVYGAPMVSVAETHWVHSSADDQCPCSHCATEREEFDL